MVNLCWLCETFPIEAIKKPLCKGCYQACRSKNLLHIFPTTNSEQRSKQTAINKYGSAFLEDMNTLRQGDTTLVCVGNKYGLSRERVRQLYQSFFNEAYTFVAKEKKSANHKIRIQKHIEYNKFENRLNRSKKHCSCYTGIIAEHLFNEKCKVFGYVVEMHTGLFDATVNGIPVDVKSRSRARHSANKGTQLYYNFHSRLKQRRAINFVACYLIDEDSWYIVPSSQFTGNTFYIPKYDLDHGTYHKYRDIQKYREAWHLLKGGENA
jgi:hypothetical protein